MRLKPLSIIPYYGGKYRMAYFISDMLDYDNTDIFIAPFGGGCRVLLNKPRHKREIYMEINAGVGHLVKALSDMKTGKRLIDRICMETDYAEDCFLKFLHISNEYENKLSRVIVKELGDALEKIDKKKKYGLKLKKNFYAQFDNTVQCDGSYIDIKSIFKDKFDCLDEDTQTSLVVMQDNVNACIKSFYASNSETVYIKRDENGNIVEERAELKLDYDAFKDAEGMIEIDRFLEKQAKALKISKEQLAADNELMKKVIKPIKSFINDMYRENFYNTVEVINENADIDDLILALATYVIYTQGRDGMGKVFNKTKFKNSDSYYKKVSDLMEVIYRLEGVEVLTETNAFNYRRIYDYFNDERAMVYCDPPYLKDKDVNDVPLNRGLVEYNPGIVYKDGWTYVEHIWFLELVKDAKCKLLISNYDDQSSLYDTMLCDYSSRWKKYEYKTYTSVGSNRVLRDNKRTECLWYNY